MEKSTKNRLPLIEVVCLLLGVILLPAPPPAFAARLTVTWAPSPEADVAGYQIHYGTAPGSYNGHVTVEEPVTSFQLSALQQETTYYVALTAFDACGNESAPSAEATGTTDCDTRHTYYRDYDGDGYGWSGDSLSLCEPLPGYVSNAADFDDSNPTIYPGAPERCDGLDNDGNRLVDEGLVYALYYRDADGDGYGEGAAVKACYAPAGYVAKRALCSARPSPVGPAAKRAPAYGAASHQPTKQQPSAKTQKKSVSKAKAKAKAEAKAKAKTKAETKAKAKTKTKAKAKAKAKIKAIPAKKSAGN
ncbi:MAG: MopE-related protein [Pseudomonadota bacterium]